MAHRHVQRSEPAQTSERRRVNPLRSRLRRHSHGLSREEDRLRLLILHRGPASGALPQRVGLGPGSHDWRGGTKGSRKLRHPTAQLPAWYLGPVCNTSRPRLDLTAFQQLYWVAGIDYQGGGHQMRS
jgi:hypothetical protein